MLKVGVVAAVNFKSYTTDWAPIIGQTPAIFVCIMSSMLDLQMGTWFLMIHISYYSISHRISTLISLINMDNGPNEEQSGQNQKTVVIKTILVQPVNNDDKSKKDLAQKLRICGNVFDSISRATADLNSVFSVPVLLILVTKLINSIVYLFKFILYYLKSERPVFSEVQSDINFLSNFIFLMTLMTSFDMPIYEVQL